MIKENVVWQVLRRRQDLNLLNLSSSRLLVSFIWSTLMSLGLSREQYRDHFQMSELEFGLVHHRPEFFEEIWSLRSSQLTKSEVDNLLSVAAALNLPEFVHLLLTKGADPNFVDSNGYTALFHAATHEAPNLKVMQLLLDHGANPNVQDRHGTTLLRHMNVIYYPDIVRMLLEKGADPNGGPQGWTPLANLIRFSSAKCVPIIKLLLDHGADPNVLDHNGKPMLNLIIQRGDVEMLRALLDKGAATDHVDDHGRTFLHHAISCKKVESIASITRLLLEKGIDPKSKDLDGRTAIDYATDVNVELVKMLIGQAADPEQVDHQRTSTSIAC
jgi:ankyrin repeat protein